MTVSLSTLESADRELLNLLQGDFPLERHPFRIIGDRLGISTEEALERTRSLQEAGLVRSIAGIFDPFRIGYKSTLAAMHVEAEMIRAAAAVVSGHPGVSHNYARDHYFNLWFTLSIPAEEDAAAIIADLAKRAGAGASINLPAVRIFKLRVFFDMSEDGDDVEAASAEPGRTTRVPEPGRGGLTLDDKRVVKQLCHDLPLVEEPYDLLAGQVGLDREYFIATATRLMRSGAMRRMSAVLRHQKAGFVANGMTCWKLPEERIEEAGVRAAARREVSHCYQRRTAPGWPYNLLAMIHGRSREECRTAADAISQEIGVAEYLQLFSTADYKKEKVRYYDSVV